MVLMKEDNFKTILEVAELKICDALRDFYHCCKLQTATLLK